MKIVTSDALAALSAAAAGSDRLRLNHNLHAELSDPIQRLCNAFEPGSYVRPHRHTDPSRWELFVVMRGEAAVLGFDASGQVLDRIVLGADRVMAVEIPAGDWHTVVSLMPGTVLFEIKPGPYAPVTGKDLAQWAPEEGDARCPELVAWFENARPGDRCDSAGDRNGRSDDRVDRAVDP